MKNGIIYSFIISLVICMIMPFSVLASTTGNQVSFTNNTYYSGNIKLYRVEIQPQTGYTGNTYTYGYYFQTDPGMYGLLSGNFDNNNNDVWSVAVQNGISEMFYSNKISCYLKSATLVEYNQTLPQEVIDYIANLDSNVELTVDLIDKLVQLRQWNVPFESFPAVLILNQQLNPIDLLNYNYYNYPIFDVDSNTIVFKNYFTNQERYDNIVIFMTNAFIPQVNRIQNNFLFNTNDITLSDYTVINTFLDNNSTYWFIVKFKIHYSGSQDMEITMKPKSNFKFIPIYFNRINQTKYISTDFGLLYGLSNQLLDDLHIIAQGTQQSQSAAGDLEQGTSDLASDISSYNQIESDYNNQMNQALNNIDFSDQFSNNQNFLSGASFVKTVFNSFMQIDILRIFFIVLCIVLIAKRFI